MQHLVDGGHDVFERAGVGRGHEDEHEVGSIPERFEDRPGHLARGLVAGCASRRTRTASLDRTAVTPTALPRAQPGIRLSSRGRPAGAGSAQLRSDAGHGVHGQNRTGPDGVADARRRAVHQSGGHRPGWLHGRPSPTRPWARPRSPWRRTARTMFSANVEMKTSFLAPARAGKTLTCTAEVISGGTRVAFVEAEVTDDGRMVVRRAPPIC